MKAKVTIDRLIITIGAKKLELTLDEAKALKEVLNTELEPKNVFPYPQLIERERLVPYPVYEPPIYRPIPLWQRGYEFYCQGRSSNEGNQLQGLLTTSGM